jgi:hypothetical protein
MDKKDKRKEIENKIKKLLSEKEKLEKNIGKENGAYCKECKKSYPKKDMKTKHWWNGDSEDPGDDYQTCPKGHQILEDILETLKKAKKDIEKGIEEVENNK